MASSTTEGQAGGNVRSSEAAVEHDGEQVTLERKATVISYAVEADGIVTTARRAADAAGNDQVLLVLLKSDYTLERLQVWDTLGMRGTHSEGFTLRARAAAGQILPEPYERIHAQTMVPFAHLLWGSVWAGIAAAAAAKAQAFIRHVVRQSNGQMPPGAAHFTQAVSTSAQCCAACWRPACAATKSIMSDEKAISSLEFQAMITLTKVQVSELAVTTVLSSLRACGLSGYRNDTEFTIGRLLRDVLSAPIMISNDRILSNLADDLADDAAAGLDQRLSPMSARQRLRSTRSRIWPMQLFRPDGCRRRLCAHRAVRGSGRTPRTIHHPAARSLKRKSCAFRR